jgi:hypothetical protein
MFWVGFEPTIPVFERAKTVHALDRATTMIDYNIQYWGIYMDGRMDEDEIQISRN